MKNKEAWGGSVDIIDVVGKTVGAKKALISFAAALYFAEYGVAASAETAPIYAVVTLGFIAEGFHQLYKARREYQLISQSLERHR